MSQLNPNSIHDCQKVVQRFASLISHLYTDEMVLTPEEAKQFLEASSSDIVLEAVYITSKWVEKIKSQPDSYIPSRKQIMRRIWNRIEWSKRTPEERAAIKEKHRLERNGTGVRVLRNGDGPRAITQSTSRPVPPKPQFTQTQIDALREAFQYRASDGTWTITEEEAKDLLARYKAGDLLRTFSDVGEWTRTQPVLPTQEEILAKTLWLSEANVCQPAGAAR